MTPTSKIVDASWTLAQMGEAELREVVKSVLKSNPSVFFGVLGLNDDKFKVVVAELSGCWKINLIKIARHAMGCGLAEAKYWVEDQNGGNYPPPGIFGQNLSKDAAEELAKTLNDQICGYSSDRVIRFEVQPMKRLYQYPNANDCLRQTFC